MASGENMSKQIEPGKTFSLEYAFPQPPLIRSAVYRNSGESYFATVTSPSKLRVRSNVRETCSTFNEPHVWKNRDLACDDCWNRDAVDGSAGRVARRRRQEAPR